MKTICESNDTRGRKFKDESMIIINDLNNFYDKYYEQTIMENFKISYTNLSQLIEYEATSILTCLSNHIQEDFQDMLNRYINILVDIDKLKENNSNTEINRRLNKLKSEENMINNFQKKFGSPENTVVLIGDFSEKHQMKFCEPTKGKSIRKLFYETGEELVNFKWDKKRNKYVHRLLGSKILKSKDNKNMNKTGTFIKELLDMGHRPTIINRDLNGSLNIRYRGWHVIHGLEIPSYLKYTRNADKKVQKNRKRINCNN
jgi:hypothetical protein